MKNLLIVVCLLLLGISGCKDDEVKPLERGHLEDLLGTWVSVDSMMGRLQDGTFAYIQDTIVFVENYKYQINSNDIIKKCLLTERAIYQFDYFQHDSINLNLYLYRNSGVLDMPYLNINLHVNFSTNKDTLNLISLSKTHPYTRFDNFYKI